jgi:hypothetical protein
MTPRHQRTLGRRKLLFALGGAAVAAPAVAALAPHALADTKSMETSAAQAGALPLTLVNNSGSFDNANVHVYVVGNVDGKQVRVTPDGTIAPIALSDNGADGFTDYAISLNSGAETTISLPYLSGRIYVSLGAKLKFKAVADGNGNPALQYPAGWVTSDPNYGVLHDCAEFTHNASGMFCNTTMVDMFSIPLSITLTGAKKQTTGTLKAGGRNQIFSALKADPVFSKLVVNDLRVIAPGHGIEAGLFPGTFFAPFIDQVFAKYAAQPMKVTANGKTFTGQVSGGKLVFDGGCQAFAKPSTRDVLFCDGALAAPNDGVTGPVAAMLGAAFNRTTLLATATQPVSDPRAFYQEKVTNLYSKAMHDASADGKAYGFAFDDVGNHEALVHDGNPQQAYITLDPFN